MSDSEEPPPVIVRNAATLQRLKLEKLMKNPEKPVLIPERQKERKLPHVPDFVRNVMGSSAGAGSGEFHVYRHLRRKEYARQKHIQERGEKMRKDEAYQQKLEDNKKAAEEKTAKKRAKRLKRKEKLKKRKLLDKGKPKSDTNNQKSENDTPNTESDLSESDTEDKPDKNSEENDKENSDSKEGSQNDINNDNENTDQPVEDSDSKPDVKEND